MTGQAPQLIGEVDRSGTWTDGLAIGSDAWIQVNMSLDMIRIFINEGGDTGQLMGVLDQMPLEGEGR